MLLEDVVVVVDDDDKRCSFVINSNKRRVFADYSDRSAVQRASRKLR